MTTRAVSGCRDLYENKPMINPKQFMVNAFSRGEQSLKLTSLTLACLVAAVGLLLTSTHTRAQAAETPTEEVLAEVRAAIEKNLPDIAIDSVDGSAIDGLYELVSGGQIYYVSADAAFLVDGEIIDLTNRVNVTAARKGRLHMALINSVDEKDMLIYEPDTPSDRAITVFTDISCGYCRKLHAELDQLLDGGVRVRYVMFPRAGLESQAHRDLESVWCAENPQDAMTNAKAGGAITPARCQNPIDSHVALAEQVGLRGTPLIYLDSGEVIPGYRDAGTIVQMIKQSSPM